MGRLERGLRNASPGLLKRFAELFDCDIADLMPPETGIKRQAGAA
jgi:hypothetical protein